MDEIRQELAELRSLVAEQQRQMLELKNQVAESREAKPGREDTHPTRRGLLAAAAAAGAAALVSSPPAEAANGNALILGNSSDNIATSATGLAFTGSTVGSYGIGVTDHGLDAFPTSAAIAGHTQGNFVVGVLGYDSSTADYTVGVFGRTTNGVGIGGQAYGNTGIATGVLGYGRRRGVHGQSQDFGPQSIGVFAEAAYPSGTALAVKGVLRAKRAGRTLVSAGSKFRTIPISPLTSTSLAFATSQKHVGSIAVVAVTVKISSPTSITIWLNANAPAGGLPVAWVVIDTIGTALS